MQVVCVQFKFLMSYFIWNFYHNTLIYSVFMCYLVIDSFEGKDNNKSYMAVEVDICHDSKAHPSIHHVKH